MFRTAKTMTGFDELKISNCKSVLKCIKITKLDLNITSGLIKVYSNLYIPAQKSYFGFLNTETDMVQIVAVRNTPHSIVHLEECLSSVILTLTRLKSITIFLSVGFFFELR